MARSQRKPIGLIVSLIAVAAVVVIASEMVTSRMEAQIYAEAGQMAIDDFRAVPPAAQGGNIAASSKAASSKAASVQASSKAPAPVPAPPVRTATPRRVTPSKTAPVSVEDTDWSAGPITPYDPEQMPWFSDSPPPVEPPSPFDPMPSELGIEGVEGDLDRQ